MRSLTKILTLFALSLCLLFLIIPSTEQQFSYSANWGKRSSDKYDSLEKSVDDELLKLIFRKSLEKQVR